MMAAIGLMMAMGANAQYLNESETPFTEGKFYVSASASSASLAYSKSTDFALGINGSLPIAKARISPSVLMARSVICLWTT